MGRSCSSSSSSSRFGRHSGISAADVDYSSVDQIDKLNNWGEFQRVLDGIKEKKSTHQVTTKSARAARKWIEPSPYISYPAEAMENLAEIVGLRNRGIKYTPDLNAANTAQIWLNKRKAAAPSTEILAEYNKYKVEEADLDNNPDIRDNVIVYSDRDLGKIYSIDGYQLTSRQKKVNQRNIHSAFPIKEVRSDVMNLKFKTDLKAWLTKYPTPQQQRNHPFEIFVRSVPPFEILKDELNDFFLEYGILMYIKANAAGNLSVSNYITLIQKLTAALNWGIMIQYFRVPEDYDFNLDDQHTKKAGS
jgi:hypothetical protein